MPSASWDVLHQFVRACACVCVCMVYTNIQGPQPHCSQGAVKCCPLLLCQAYVCVHYWCVNQNGLNAEVRFIVKN